jgi:acyl dehydratase
MNEGPIPMQQRYFEDVQVGDSLDEARHCPSRVQLFRYSAATWNSHRIHYDAAYAELEGYPDVLVQSHLHGAFLSSLCTDFAGPAGRLETLEVSVRRYATADTTLVCRGSVTKTEALDGNAGKVYLDLEEVREADGVVCAPATAVVRLPCRAPGGADGRA